MDRGANKDLLDEYGFSIINQIQFPRNPDKVGVEMLDLLQTENTLNLPGLLGNTLLHRAAFVQSYEQVRYLIDHGADINIMNDKKLVALDIAIKDPEGRLRTEVFPLDIIEKLVPENNVTIYDIIRKIVESHHHAEYADVLRCLVHKLNPYVPLRVCLNINNAFGDCLGSHVYIDLAIHDESVWKGYKFSDRRSRHKLTLYVTYAAAALFSKLLIRTCIHIHSLPINQAQMLPYEASHTQRAQVRALDEVWVRYCTLFSLIPNLI